jgi:hypothetical protein
LGALRRSGWGGEDLLNFDVPNVIPEMFCDFYSAMHLFFFRDRMFFVLKEAHSSKES